jgi:hypothetical protein
MLRPAIGQYWKPYQYSPRGVSVGLRRDTGWAGRYDFEMASAIRDRDGEAVAEAVGLYAVRIRE